MPNNNPTGFNQYHRNPAKPATPAQAKKKAPEKQTHEEANPNCKGRIIEGACEVCGFEIET